MIDLILPLIIVTLFVALTLNIYLRRFHIPPIIGYIAAGTVIAHFSPFKAGESKVLAQIAEFGIAFLMFTIGLEFSIGHLKNMRREVLINGVAQITLTFMLIGFVAHRILGLDLNSAIIAGLGLSLSSTAIVLKILNDNGDIKRNYGRLSFGILLAQDLAVIPMLLMIGFMSSEGTNLLSEILQTIGSALLLGLTMIIVGRRLLDPFLAAVIDAKSHEIFIGAILLLVLSASWLAHLLGFSFSLGAFIAGMIIAETHYKHQIEADLAPFRDLLLGLFFVTVGLQIDLNYAVVNIISILVITVGVMLLKAIVVYPIIRSHHRPNTALKSAITLMQIGEFSFVIFEIARMEGMLESSLQQTLIIAATLSMVATPFIMRHLKTITRLIIKEEQQNDLTPVSAPLSSHIIVCGYGRLGLKIAAILKEMDIPHLFIEKDRRLVEEGIERGDAVFFGNAAQRQILEKHNATQALAVIVAIDNEQAMLLVCQNLLSMGVENIVVKVETQQEYEMVKSYGITNIVDQNLHTAGELVLMALRCELKRY
ncbi:MAG: cation:proton antiporter [Campylobacterales bacterium]